MTPLQYEPAARRDWQPRRALPKRDGGIARILVREQIEPDLVTARGQALLPVAHLQKKLGKSTFRLWSVLLTLRNDGGWTHPSLPGLARATKLGEAQVEKSLARLRQFKLLEDFGFHWLRVPCRCDPEVGAHEHKVYLRRVYGLLRADRSNQEFTAVVPSETAQLVKKASGQGGARAGAGRPKSSTNTKASENKPRKSNVGAYKNQEPISQEEPYGSSEKCGVSLRVNSGKTKSQRTLQREREREAFKRFLEYRPPSHQRTGGEPVPNLSQPQAPAATRSALLHADQPAAPAILALDGVVQHADGSMGFSGRGGYKRPQRYTSEDLKASTELAGQIQAPRTPAPPRLTADASEEARLALLRVAYKAAHAKALRQEFWRPARSQSVAERKALLEAAEALVSENLRPHSWALFSFLAWQRMGKKTAPSVKWVWSATRIHEHAQWCHEATGSQDSSKPLHCPSVKELAQRLGKLQQRLGWGRPTSEVVCEVLSDTERRVLLAKAATERDAALADIERRINAGEWVW